MNDNYLNILLLILCLVVGFTNICVGKDHKTSLMVKKIVFTSDKDGGERIEILCNQSCVPELLSLEEGIPRVVVDMKGVFLIQNNARNFDTGGKLVKRVRSYLDKKTKTLRIVLDMDPNKYYIVHAIQDHSGNKYILTIHEKPGGSKVSSGSSRLHKKHIN